MSGVQSCMPRASVVVRSSAGIYPPDNITVSLTAAVAFSDQQSTGLASYHAPTLCMATRISLLLVRACGTVCHRIYDETLATDYSGEN